LCWLLRFLEKKKNYFLSAAGLSAAGFSAAALSAAGLSDLKKSPIVEVVESQAELNEAQPVKHKAVNITEIKVRDLSERNMVFL
jgi:hypothetical protein